MYSDHVCLFNIKIIIWQNLLNMAQQVTLPAFSLYNVGMDCSKTCYQSQNLTVFFNTVGPYFERSKSTIDPNFNCNILGTNFSEQKISYLAKKIREVVALTIVKQKYLRMNFDINFQIVEMKEQEELFPALINLLCFSFVLSGIEIKSLFSCSQVWLDDEKVYWQGNRKDNSPSTVKKMCIVLESSQKQVIYSQFEGQFVFVHFQRLGNLLMDANEQIHNYIVKKVNQVNEQYQE